MSGVKANVGWVPVTVTESAVVETAPPTVHVLVKVAVRAPVADGVAVTSMVQLPPPLVTLLTPQLSVEIVKSPGLVPPKVGAVHPVASAVPELVIVKVWAAVVTPTTTFPKAWVAGDMAREG